MASSKESVCKAFYDMSIQFIDASIEVWPQDALLQIAAVQIRAVTEPGSFLDQFDSIFGSYVDKLASKDTQALFEAAKNPLVAALDIQLKFEGASESTRETIWTYITNLCRFVTMNKLYKHIPTNVLDAVSVAAEDLKVQMDNGTMDTANINPFELGQQVMAKFNPNEIQDIMKNIMSNQDVMNSMMTQMTSLLGQSGGLQGLPAGTSEALQMAMSGGSETPDAMNALFQSFMKK